MGRMIAPPGRCLALLACFCLGTGCVAAPPCSRTIAGARCSGEPSPPPELPRPPLVAAFEDASAPPAPDVPESILRWAGDEPAAIVDDWGKVLVQAMGTGRSRVLWPAGANAVLLDTALDLLWIQGLTTALAGYTLDEALRMTALDFTNRG